MKTKYIFKMKSKSSWKNFMLVMLFAVAGIFCSCNSDDIEEDAYYTFTGETVASYCKNTNNLSIFYRIIEESGSYPLLSVYGHFTCFIPTDSAFNAYFREMKITYDDLTKEDKLTIVNDHIINGKTREYFSEDFQEGALPVPNMSDRFLVVSYTGEDQGKQIIVINKSAAIIEKDNKVHNGAIHIVGNIVKPSQNDLPSVMKEKTYFKLFSQAIEMTHLGDSIMGIYDDSYKDPFPGLDEVKVGGHYLTPIHTKKLGYTILAETDDVFKTAGINTIDDLIEFAKKYYGTQDLNNYTSRNNPLNKFVSYHMLNRQMSTNSFIYSGKNTSGYAMNKRYEYYETMLKMRLIEMKAPDDFNTRSTVQINTQKNKSFVGVDIAKSNLDGMNGYIHALQNILVYDENIMSQDVLNKRIRFDAYSIPPQFTNNNIRWNFDAARTFTGNFCDEYFTLSPSSKLKLWGSESWDAHQADEIVVVGWYDFTLRLPPIPPGTYEIRFGYNAVSWRGIAQLFIDGQIAGIPVDLSMTGDNPKVGWVKDGTNLADPNGDENDKMMRNRGYMKSGRSIINSGYGHTLRDSQNDIRVIVGTYTFQNYDYHYFRAKNVEREDGEFQLDYIEYVPVSYIDKEDKD